MAIPKQELVRLPPFLNLTVLLDLAKTTAAAVRKHSYMIVADWVKASHKSQSGDMNQSMHRGELEAFWYFKLNGDERINEVKQLFDTLKKSGFPTK